MYSGTSVTGFDSGTLASPYVFHLADAVASRAQQDLEFAYGAAAAWMPTRILSGQDLGGITLTPGTYSFATTAQLTGKLTLDDLGDPNAQFLFQIGTSLTTSTNSSVVVTANGALSSDDHVFWQVGSSATLDTQTAFDGHILAYASITVNGGSTDLDGSLLALNGAVTLDTNRIFNPGSVPGPTSLALVLVGGTLAGMTSVRRRRTRTTLPILISPGGLSRP